MARYRVGNKFLSEDEFHQHNKSKQEASYFFGGFVITFLLFMYGVPKYLPEVLSLDKWIRVLIYLLPSLLIGWACLRLSNLISTLFAYFIVFVFFFIIGSVIWRVV